MKGLAICITIMLLLANTIQAQKNVKTLKILPGAYQMETYLPLLKGKKVAVFANQTSVIEQTHLVDTLLKRGIKITKAFAPEHGFRGTADAGEKVDNTVDASTGVSIVSLYGKKRKPTAEELTDVDIIVFDIQDVGTRFYTFISSLEEIMETAIQFNKPLIVLDRPNPNGFYVDGPVLDTTFKSFIGMQPIPIVYGMTIGEYAKMLLGEKMLNWKYIKKQDEQITLGKCLALKKKEIIFR
ncbi:MAG: exo-beta-N-acetylmuramidase NamZ domain-containing protein [Chitinophagaceae bacterium]